MGMYHSILLRPASSQVIPSSKNILRLLEWLVENDEIIKPAIKPIQVELWSIPINNKVFDVEDLQEFSTISTELEAIISTNREWTMPLGITGNGPISKCFELDMEQIANLASLEDEDDENEYIEGALLEGIRISQLNLNYHKNAHLGAKWDSSYPDGKFAIELESSMKLGYPIEEPQEFFDLVWPNVESAGIFSKIEEILEVSLVAEADFS